MIKLKKPVTRKTSAVRYEKSKHREIVVSLEPRRQLSFRLLGTRQHYRLDVETAYEIAVKLHAQAIEKRAQRLKKQGVKIRSARAQARRELAERLKSK
jgi:hypothetical protein